MRAKFEPPINTIGLLMLLCHTRIFLVDLGCQVGNFKVSVCLFGDVCQISTLQCATLFPCTCDFVIVCLVAIRAFPAWRQSVNSCACAKGTLPSARVRHKPHMADAHEFNDHRLNNEVSQTLLPSDALM